MFNQKHPTGAGALLHNIYPKLCHTALCHKILGGK